MVAYFHKISAKFRLFAAVVFCLLVISRPAYGQKSKSVTPKGGVTTSRVNNPAIKANKSNSRPAVPAPNSVRQVNGSNGGSTAGQPQKQTLSSQKIAKLNGGELYLKAREFFAAGRYADAIKYAAAAQRRTKQSKLPTVLVAQSYYRLGKIARASKLFLAVPLNEIPKDAVIDYMLTMFSARRYKEVIKAYPAVPDNHPYKDIARFYTGVSLIQFRLYEKAQYLLRNARKLPSSLISQKRRLLSEIDTIRDRERGQSLDQGQQYFGFQQAQPFSFYAIPSAPPPPPVAEPILPGGTPGKPAASAKPAAPTGPSTSYIFKLGFDYAQKSTFNDFHGFKETRSDNRTPGASALAGLKYLGAPRPFGAQPSLDLAINPGYSHTESTKSSSSLTATEADPDTVQNVVSKSESSSYSASNTYGLTGLYPISDPVDVGLSYTVSDSYANANPKKVSTDATASAKIAAELDLFKIDLGYDSTAISSKESSSSNRTNSVIKANVTRNGENSTTSVSISKTDKGKPLADGDGVKNITSAQISWLRNFDDFALGISLKKTDKVRLPEQAKGVVLGETTGKLEGSYNLSFGVSAVGSVAFSQFQNLVVFKDAKLDGADAPAESMASGTGTKYSLGVKVAPVSFVSLNASYDYAERQLSIGDELLKKRMMQDNWSLQTVTVIGISASYSF